MPRLTIFHLTSLTNIGRLLTDGSKNFTYRLKELVAGTGVTITDDVANNSLVFDVSGAGITELTGDVTAGPGTGSQAATIAADAVSNAKMANMAAHTIKGNNTAGSANPLDLTGTEVTAELDVVVGDSGAGGTKGLVPAPSAGDAAAGKFLKADGTFAVPAGGGGSDWDTTIVKSADQDNTTTTLADAVDLTIAVLNGETWMFEMVIPYGANGTGVDFKLNAVFPQANGVYRQLSITSGDGASSTAVRISGTTSLTTLVCGTRSVITGFEVARIEVQCSFLASGDFKVQFAANAAGTARIAAGSILRGKKLV